MAGASRPVARKLLEAHLRSSGLENDFRNRDDPAASWALQDRCGSSWWGRSRTMRRCWWTGTRRRAARPLCASGALPPALGVVPRLVPNAAGGPVGREARETGLGSAIGAPITVEDRLWGAIGIGSIAGRLALDAEARLASFTELVATALANAESRAELMASRARIVAAADEERRRVVRDLHDGAQQRLVHTIITLKLTCGALAQDQEAVHALVHDALDNAERANVELRELAHGILPMVLIEGGLSGAVSELAICDAPSGSRRRAPTLPCRRGRWLRDRASSPLMPASTTTSSGSCGATTCVRGGPPHPP
jgi:signal transduction histidine kinase